MNATRIELPPFQPVRFEYPTLLRAIIESVLTLGRTVLVTGVGLGLLIGFAMVIAFAVTTGAYMLGFDAAADY